MKVSRTMIAASWLLASCSALSRAPAAATRADATAPRGVPSGPAAKAPEGPFLVKPYLQIGHTQVPGKLVLMWHAEDVDADWAVEYRPGPGTRWQAPAKAPSARRV